MRVRYLPKIPNDNDSSAVRAPAGLTVHLRLLLGVIMGVALLRPECVTASIYVNPVIVADIRHDGPDCINVSAVQTGAALLLTLNTVWTRKVAAVDACFRLGPHATCLEIAQQSQPSF